MTDFANPLSPLITASKFKLSLNTFATPSEVCWLQDGRM